KLAVRSRHVESPVKLLADYMNQNRVLTGRKFVYPFSPKRDGEANKQHGFNEDAGEFQVRGDRTAHAVMISFRMAALVETEQDKNEKSGPTDKERAHEPMRELENVIDLVAMLGSIRRLPEKLVDQREATHPCSNPPSIARAGAAASGHGAKS